VLLTPLNRSRLGHRPTIACTDFNSNSANQTSYNTGAENIGDITGHFRRIVFLCVGMPTLSAAPSGVTKDGNAMTKLTDVTSSTINSSIWYLEDNSASTTATFVITCGGTATSINWGVFALYDSIWPNSCPGIPVIENKNAYDTGSTCNLTAVLHSRAVGLAHCYTAGGSAATGYAWSGGLTERYDAAVEATSTYSGATFDARAVAAPGAISGSMVVSGGPTSVALVSAYFI
jgi:hypothetical protein